MMKGTVQIPAIVIKNFEDACEAGQYYTATCSHVHESEESDMAAEVRSAWYKKMRLQGFRTKVAFFNESPVGFLHMVPIEHSHWGPIGKDLMVILCSYVANQMKGKGIGRALLEAAEGETKKEDKKALVVCAYYYEDFWFMPALFYEKHGFIPIKRRKVTKEGEKDFLDEEAILWKIFDELAEPPCFPKPSYAFQPIEGKVVVDLFSDPFCKPIEAQRVREVAKEFGDKVIINEYPTDNRTIFEQYQISRAIFINGQEIGWGYIAPRDGIRKAVQEALNELSPS
ncbi:MAG: GNAT family N-acetyltransferase [Candidatus Heimdallarchaeota archaeon]